MPTYKFRHESKHRCVAYVIICRHHGDKMEWGHRVERELSQAGTEGLRKLNLVRFLSVFRRDDALLRAQSSTTQQDARTNDMDEPVSRPQSALS